LTFKFIRRVIRDSVFCCIVVLIAMYWVYISPSIVKNSKKGLKIPKEVRKVNLRYQRSKKRKSKIPKK
jgi:hypothetical protein